MKRLTNFLKDARSIWAGILILTTAAAWGGDLRWMQKSEYRLDQKISIVKQINREIAVLKIKLLYTPDKQQQAMMKAIIINSQTEIKNIKEE